MSSRSKRGRDKDILRRPAPAPPDEPPSPTALQITEQSQELTVRSGPIPDAQEMARYAEIDPCFPDRILAMAENQSAHRMQVQREAVSAEISDRRRERLETNIGQGLGAVVAMTGILGGVYVAAQATEWTGQVAGALISGATLLGIVKALIIGKQAALHRETHTDRSNAPKKS